MEYDIENIVTVNADVNVADVGAEEITEAVEAEHEAVVVTSNKIRHKKSTYAKQTFSWNEDNFEFPVQIDDRCNFTIPQVVLSPFMYFRKFFDEDLVTLIVENTNLYSTQQTGTCINVTRNEINDFIAIELMTGLINMHAYTDYWSKDFRYDKVANIMPLKRFETIRRYIHFVNNEEQNDDRFFKVRPVLESLRKNCLSIEQERRHSIDEMMIPYKGTKSGSRRQYIKNKPKKWGFKLYTRAGVSGFIYDFIMYGGENTFSSVEFSRKEESFGLSGKVVITLSKTISNAPGAVVYFDNFFSSFEVMRYLRNEIGILSLGTFRSNKLRGCVLKSDKDLKKDGRGSFHQVADNSKKVTAVKWLDSKPVVLGSSYMSTDPVTTIKRYSKNDKRQISVPCPAIVKEYNLHMGGVDLSDMLVALYRTKLKTRRWYLNIFSQVIDICVNNAWLLYRRDSTLLDPNKKTMPLKTFRHEIFESLTKKNRTRRSINSRNNFPVPGPQNKIRKIIGNRPNNDIRYDNVDHFPIFESRGRCKFCRNGQTNITCSKCKMRLCLTENRNCFLLFHKK